MSDEALKLEVEAIDAVPEPIRPLYQQTESGKYRLRVDGVEDVSGLKSALQKEREERKRYEAQAKKWGSLGIDPDEAAKVLAERQAAEQERLKKAGDYDALLRQTAEKYERALAEARAEAEAERQAARQAVVESSLAAELTRAGVLPEGQQLLSRMLSDRIQYQLDSGKRVVRVLKEDGEIMAGPSGNPASVEDLVKSAREQFPMLFRASGLSGGGKPHGGGVSATAGMTRSKMSADDKAAFLEKHGMAEYLKLPLK